MLYFVDNNKKICYKGSESPFGQDGLTEIGERYDGICR